MGVWPLRSDAAVNGDDDPDDVGGEDEGGIGNPGALPPCEPGVGSSQRDTDQDTDDCSCTLTCAFGVVDLFELGTGAPFALIEETDDDARGGMHCACPPGCAGLMRDVAMERAA